MSGRGIAEKTRSQITLPVRSSAADRKATSTFLPFDYSTFSPPAGLWRLGHSSRTADLASKTEVTVEAVSAIDYRVGRRDARYVKGRPGRLGWTSCRTEIATYQKEKGPGGYNQV